MIHCLITTKNGDGYSTTMKFDSLEDVSLRVGTFREDCVITFYEVCDEHENSYPCELCREERERKESSS